MEIFKLLGNLIVQGADKAKKDIEGTGQSAEKASGIFEKVGATIEKVFTSKKVEALGVSLDKLNGSISNQQKKLDLLKNKYTDLYLSQGESSEEAKEVAAEIEKLSSELSKNKKALGDAKNAADKFDKTLDDVEKSAEKAGKETKEAFDKIAKAAKVAVGAVTAVGAAVVALAETTREYRLEMGKLETAFTTAGHTTEDATETYRTLYSILGETERAVEASQHIAKLCENEEQMKLMTDACIGAFAEFDDSLPIEGLMEAANETAKTGQLTGVLVDALNWAGSSEVAFQEKLNACNSERERAALITEELIALYADSAEAYKETNKAIIEAAEAQERLNAATARWGEFVEPWVTSFKNAWTDIINSTVDSVMFGNFEEDLSGTMETVEEAAEYVAALRLSMETLYATPVDEWTTTQESAYTRLSTILANAEARYNELAEAEQKAADEATEAASEAQEAAAKTAEATEQFSTITEQYVADAQNLFERFAATYDGIYNRVASFFDPFEKAKTTVRTNITDMMSAMQSQVEFNNSYTANLQALKEYGLGSLSDAFQSYGAEGAAYAQAIVDAVEKAGGATTEEGQAIIQGFTDINQSLTESQESLSQTMTLLNGEFEAELQNMNESYGAAIDALDKSAEANTAAIATFEGFLQGMNAKFPEIKKQMTSFGKQITDALQKGIDSVSIPITFQGNIPGYETGLDYVPYDNYLAYLHKGEAVLTADEATAWRAGKSVAQDGNSGDSGSGGGVTVNQYIEAVPQTPVELASATAAYFEQARWVT